MKKTFGFGDDDDDDLDRPSPLLQTQRFAKSGTIGTKDLKMTQQKSKHNEVPNLKFDLDRINDDNDDDSLNDSDDDTNTKTGRSTSSVTTSQLTPKPKERSFLRNNTEKPKIQPRRIDIDDDDRNVFGQTTMKPSPRHQILTLREEEERDQSFMHGFKNENKRQSPTDPFSTYHKPDSQRNNRKFSNDHDNKEHHDSDDEIFSNKQTKQHSFQKSRHSPTDSDKSQSRKNSNRSKEENDLSDDDDNDHLNKQSKRQDYRKQRQSTHDLVPVIYNHLIVPFNRCEKKLINFHFRHHLKILIRILFNINHHPVDLVQERKTKLNLLDVHRIVKIKIQLFLQ